MTSTKMALNKKTKDVYLTLGWTSGSDGIAKRGPNLELSTDLEVIR